MIQIIWFVCSFKNLKSFFQRQAYAEIVKAWSYKFTKLNSITNLRSFFAFKAFVMTGNICSSYSLLRSYWWQKEINLNSLNFQISNLFRHSFLSGHVHMNRYQCEISTREKTFLRTYLVQPKKRFIGWTMQLY